jgi:hypothetical protein
VLGLGVEIGSALVLARDPGRHDDGVALVAGIFHRARELLEVLRHGPKDVVRNGLRTVKTAGRRIAPPGSIHSISGLKRAVTACISPRLKSS